MSRGASLVAGVAALSLMVSATPSFAAACKEPAFADYPAAPAPQRRPAVRGPVLDSKGARAYRTTIRAAFAAPADFAGHNRVATWGCGTECMGFAIVDKVTGHVAVWDDWTVVPDQDPDDMRQVIEYKPDSALFIITGCLGEVICYPARLADEYKDKFKDDKSPPPLVEAKRLFYVWTGRALRLIGQCPL